MSRSRETADIVESKNQCTAWCAFDGTTGALLAGYNVDRIDIVSAGRYNVIFDTPMDNDDYCVNVSGQLLGFDTKYSSSANWGNTFVEVRAYSDTAYINVPRMFVQIFGGKN